MTWGQAVGGLWPLAAGVWHDYADTLPVPGVTPQTVTLYGLHLPDASRPGALIAFGEAALYESAKALRKPADVPNAAQALAQCERLPALARAQGDNVAEVWRGLNEAATRMMPRPSDSANGRNSISTRPAFNPSRSM